MNLLEQVDFHNKEARRLSGLIKEQRKNDFQIYIGRYFKYDSGICKILSVEYVYEDEENKADVSCLFANRPIVGEPYFNTNYGLTIEFDRLSGECCEQDFKDCVRQVSEKILSLYAV